MEDVLDLYEQPYDARRPVVAIDERPCQLIGDVLVPIAMKPGKPQRYDYEYERHGVCTVFIAVEALTGRRLVQVRARRTQTEYTEFMQMVSATWAEAECICIVQDNLNTHTPGSFYTRLAPEEAFALAQRFEMHYTPKKASWLNMAEIELSALSKQCLDRRIATQEQLTREVEAWAERRNHDQVKITWRFTKNDARQKLQRHYAAVHK